MIKKKESRQILSILCISNHLYEELSEKYIKLLAREPFGVFVVKFNF